MKMFRSYFANLFLFLLPKTRCFKLKAFLLNMLGYEIAPSARVTGDIKIYGRGQIVVGENTWIGLRCHFYTSVGTSIVIGKNCDIAPEVVFHTGTHLLGNENRRAGNGTSISINVGSGTWIGLGTKLLAGAIVGNGSLVAAGSIVLGVVHPSNVMLAGTPARKVRDFDEA